MRIFGLAGWSGSGKTTLLAAIIPELVARGVVVSTIKHAHHEFDIDRPGKELLYPDDPHVVAIASDEVLVAPIPLLPLGDAGAVATFITDHLGFGSWRS